MDVSETAPSESPGRETTEGTEAVDTADAATPAACPADNDAAEPAACPVDHDAAGSDEPRGAGRHPRHGAARPADARAAAAPQVLEAPGDVRGGVPQALRQPVRA